MAIVFGLMCILLVVAIFFAYWVGIIRHITRFTSRHQFTNWESREHFEEEITKYLHEQWGLR